MTENREVIILKKEYERLIENINKRTSINSKGINKFKAEFRSRPIVMNVKIVKNLFDINTDGQRLKVYESALEDLGKNPDKVRDIKKEVARVIAEINRGISPRRQEMNLAINEYRKNMNKKYDYIICSSCGTEIKENKIVCEKCAESIGIFEKVINFCDKCGKKVPGNSKVCPGCGKSIEK